MKTQMDPKVDYAFKHVFGRQASKPALKRLGAGGAVKALPSVMELCRRQKRLSQNANAKVRIKNEQIGGELRRNK